MWKCQPTKYIIVEKLILWKKGVSELKIKEIVITWDRLKNDASWRILREIISNNERCKVIVLGMKYLN